MRNCALINLLSEPQLVESWPLKKLELAIRQAYRCDLLATLAYRLRQVGKLESMTNESAKNHFLSMLNVSSSHKKFIAWEVNVLSQLFLQHDKKLILLKGAAYTISGLPSGDGRLYGDIDLLINKPELKEIESILRQGLWLPKAMDDYDINYYREWSHEIPPVYHATRRSVLDVHHAILPPTCKLKPDSKKILNNIVPIKGWPNVYVLSPSDMVLHSMTHLFHEGEFDHGLRDLIDIDALLRFFNEKDECFYDGLVDRAKELDLVLPLYYGVRYCNRLLGTPVPEKIFNDLNQYSPKFSKIIDQLFYRALLPHHKSCDDGFSGISRWLLYVRSHYLRMPVKMLIPHLIRKAYKERTKDNRQ